MKNLLILILTIVAFKAQSQDCYKAGTANSESDFSKIWLNNTFQGTIGSSNQRIEIRFLSIYKEENSNNNYILKGKSKVNKNICDFEGSMTINEIYFLDKDNVYCEGPDYSNGYLVGTYHFKEDTTQQHVGLFRGMVMTKFNESDGNYSPFRGWSTSHGTNEFIGTWKDYNSSTPKYCSWGLQIPPSKDSNLFKHYDNEFYLFNPKIFRQRMEILRIGQS